MCAVVSQLKTVRLRALRSAQKFGVAGRSCQELLRKGCLRFQLPVQGSRLCLYEDGTEVTEDYFPGLPDDAELVLLTEGQTWQGCLESRFRNKSGYLRYSCESRIRSYLREVSSCSRVLGAEAREEYLRILGAMCQRLRSAQYNGSYFDRGAEAGSRLCTREGWFSCQAHPRFWLGHLLTARGASFHMGSGGWSSDAVRGPFDLDSCASKHSINPYSNRESRVLFSTWNLDHIHPGLSVVLKQFHAAACLLFPSRVGCVHLDSAHVTPARGWMTGDRYDWR
ncbi:DNA fragmentation factor subunit beta [Marmota monax]|uniref:DNA fragmentation factor subunit beta n=1 Tax=Marmota monax TaxID=9995 RepID=A0A834PN46_MARMO|nr:DNA fragmentation factor subunit beta [Marmota monax]